MTITQSSTRLVAVAAGVAVALALMLGASMPVRAAALSQTQIQSILNLLTSFGADQGTLNNVSAALNGQATTGTTGGNSMAGGVCPFNWSRSLTTGSKGADVMALQKFLNMDSSTMVAASGAGSAGMETSFFGPATKRAVMKMQAKYGISQVGNVGPMTRAKLNSLCTSGTSVTPTPTPGTPTPTPTGTATVSAAAQPANSVAPKNAARVPFTAFTVTAGSAPVTLNNVTVMRQGVAQDSDFAGVVLLDAATGVQLGISRVLDSNHSATIGTPITIPAGTSKTFWVAANIGSASTISGDIASFAVTAVNTNSTLSGALPIIGASNTLNGNITIGSATVTRSSFDPNSNQTEPFGTTGYRFSGVHLAADATEDQTLKSITWYQSGSASGLQNLMTVVNGTSYPATVDTTGRYYTTVFPTGIVIAKGNSIDAYIQGDITGNITSNSTVEFDVYRNTDIYLVGNTYGYGVTVSATNAGTYTSNNNTTSGFQATGNPFYFGATVTVTGGSISSIQNAPTIGAQNVGVNVQNQPLGGFQTNLLGEGITVQTLTVHFLTSTTTAAFGLLTNVSLVNENGSVVAGPYSGVTDGGGAQHVTFTGSINLPTGTHTYTLKGQLPTSAPTGSTIQASTTPSSDWSGVTGNTSGSLITLPNTLVTMSNMTVRAQALTVSVGSTPIAQSIVAGANQFTFASIILDGTASGDDVRVTSIPTLYTFSPSGIASDLSNCQLFNGSTSVTTQHPVNPSSSATSPSNQVFALDNGGVTVPKGTTLTLSLECNIRSGATGTYKWGFAGTETIGANGITSGNTVTVAVNANAGNLMSASANGGSFTVALDPSSLAYNVASAGTANIDLGHLKFNGSNEDINLKQVALQLVSGNNYDLLNNNVTLWDATTNTQVGSANFSTGSYATSTLTGSFVIPANGSRTLVIRGTLGNINVNGPITTSGDVVKVAYDGNNITGTNGTYGTGVSSSQNVVPTTASDVIPAGVQVDKSFPTFTYTTTGSVAANGTNTLLNLSVSADAKGDVTLNKLSFNATSTNATVSSLNFTGPNGSVGTVTGPDASGNVVVTFNNSSNTADAVVGYSTTKTYVLRGTLNLTGTNSTGSVSTSLLADTSAVGPASTSTLSSSNMIWSPESTSTSLVGTGTKNDWFNGYGLGGCFATAGLGQNCFQNVVSK